MTPRWGHHCDGVILIRPSQSSRPPADDSIDKRREVPHMVEARGMSDQTTAILSGMLETGARLNCLASRLARAGLSVEIRDSCHYEGGRYIRVNEGCHLTLERLNAREYLVTGDADSVDQMLPAVTRLSQTLSDLGIRHRFEVSDDQSPVFHYLHHRWPQAEGS